MTTFRRALALAALTIPLGAFAPGAAAAVPAQRVAGARVAAVADRVAHALVSGPDKSVAPAYAIVDQTVPAGTVTIAPGGTPLVTATYVSVPVAIAVDGRLARTLVAGYRVTGFVETAVAAHDLAPGTVLTDADVTLARIPAMGRPAVSAEALVGRKLRAATAKNAPLFVEQTAADEVVRAGSPAVLIVHDGPVALAADVVARTSGALGESVTVWNPQTRKALAGTVTGRDRVELTLPGGER